MPLSVYEIIAKLPKRRQAKIEVRAAEIFAEEHTRAELRKARKTSQARLAKALGVEREQLPALEKQADLHLAALRRAIKALSGKLTLSAEFPSGAPLFFSGLGEIAAWEPDEDEPAPRAKPRARPKRPGQPQYPQARQLHYSPKNEL